MARLSLPRADVRESFLAAIDELRAEGRGAPDDHSMIGRDIRRWSGRWHTPDGFAAYVAALLADRLEETPRPPDWVPSTTWWWLDDDNAVLGRICLRHRLTPSLLEEGGHIGYDVRPSARRRGHARDMLRAALTETAYVGIERALLTCDVDNIASRRVIESNGGVLEDERAGTLRFWVPTRV